MAITWGTAFVSRWMCFTGGLKDFDGFIRDFYAAYHPFYNGNIPVINPQPAGSPSRTAPSRFLGWHAITIQRLALDPGGACVYTSSIPTMTVVRTGDRTSVTSTQGNGERYGEASLPVAQFASRLYVFHYDPLEKGEPDDIPTIELNLAMRLAQESWALGR